MAIDELLSVIVSQYTTYVDKCYELTIPVFLELLCLDDTWRADRLRYTFDGEWCILTILWSKIALLATFAGFLCISQL